MMNRSSRLAGFLLMAPMICALAGGAAVAEDNPIRAQGQSPAPGARTPTDAVPPQHLDARALGVTEAVLEYCAKNDPSGAAKLHARLKRLTQGASPEALDRVRKGPEYRAARESELAFIGQVDPRNASKLCSERVASSRQTR